MVIFFLLIINFAHSSSAYEESTFCYVFHSKDSGWRECASCGKVEYL